MNRKPIADRLTAIESRLTALEGIGLQAVRLGPSPKQDEELEANRERIVKQIVESAKQTVKPVDRSCRTLLDGSPVPEDYGHTKLRADGMQENYVVLCDAERAKGFVRPVRREYKHIICGSVTTMGRALAETYARDPGFYSGTFCCNCHDHFPLDQFCWLDGEKLGS